MKHDSSFCDREHRHVTLTFELDIDKVKLNERAKCIGQRLFRSKIITRTTHTHIECLSSTTVSKKTIHLIFGYNFYECRPIFKIHSQILYVCCDRDLHLIFITSQHYFVGKMWKFEITFRLFLYLCTKINIFTRNLAKLNKVQNMHAQDITGMIYLIFLCDA